jgi:hypothetical protein
MRKRLGIRLPIWSFSPAFRQRGFSPRFARVLAAIAACATLLAALPRPAYANSPDLVLRCKAPRTTFEDGTLFAASDFVVTIDPAEGWRIEYNQFVKRFPHKVTAIIARETGTYEKFDAVSHIQIGSCRTLAGGDRAPWKTE